MRNVRWVIALVVLFAIAVVLVVVAVNVLPGIDCSGGNSC